MPATKAVIEEAAPVAVAPVEEKDEKVSALMEKLGAFNTETDTADELQKIKGVGPQMEQVLNQIGIFTFAQVSKMTNAEYDLLDSITEKFPGRAQRDDWAGQAKQLNNKK